MSGRSNESERKWKKCIDDISMKPTQMRLLPTDNKMTRMIPTIIGVSINHSKIGDTTMIRCMVGIDKSTTIARMIWVVITAGTQMKILTHTMIKI